MRRLFVRTTIGLAILAVMAATALAAAVKHRSNVDIQSTITPKLTLGTVKSDSTRCTAGRKIQVLLGKTRSQSLVVTVRADHDGNWSTILQPPKAGRYQAKAVRQRYLQNGTHNICKPDKSEKIDVH